MLQADGHPSQPAQGKAHFRGSGISDSLGQGEVVLEHLILIQTALPQSWIQFQPFKVTRPVKLYGWGQLGFHLAESGQCVSSEDVVCDRKCRFVVAWAGRWTGPLAD